MNTKALTLAALTMVVVVALGSSKATAADFSVGVGVGVGGGYGGGHYASRVDRVVVVPERHERVWVEPVYSTRYGPYGPTRVIVTNGFYRDVCVPARYEDRAVSYYVPQAVTYVAPAPVYSGGYYGGYRYGYNRPYSGSSFNFNYRR